MAFIFGHRKKSPVELVKSTKKHIDLLQPHAPQEEKLIKKVHKQHAQHTSRTVGGTEGSALHATHRFCMRIAVQVCQTVSMPAVRLG